MGTTGDDLERLRQVLVIARGTGLSLSRVRIGSVELAFHAPHPPLKATETDAGGAHLSQPAETPEERAKRERTEFEELMYAASEGPFTMPHGES